MPHEFKNVTLVFKGQDFAFGLTCLSCKTVSIEHKPYAQYKRATFITFRRPRQRKDRRVVLYYDQQLAVIEGEVDFDNFGPPREGNTPGVTSKAGKHSACAPEWEGEQDALADRCGDRVVYRQDKGGMVTKSVELAACKFKTGSPVVFRDGYADEHNNVGTVEVVDVIRDGDIYATRLVNGDLHWATEEQLQAPRGED